MSQSPIFKGLSSDDDQQEAVQSAADAAAKQVAPPEMTDEVQRVYDEQRMQDAQADVFKQNLTQQRLHGMRAGDTIQENMQKLDYLQQQAKDLKGMFPKIANTYMQEQLKERNRRIESQGHDGQLFDPIAFPTVPVVNSEGQTIGFTRVNTAALGGKPAMVHESFLDSPKDLRQKRDRGEHKHDEVFFFDGRTAPKDAIAAINNDSSAEMSAHMLRRFEGLASEFERADELDEKSRIMHHVTGVARGFGEALASLGGTVVEAIDFGIKEYDAYRQASTPGPRFKRVKQPDGSYKNVVDQDYDGPFQFAEMSIFDDMRREDGSVDWIRWFKDNPRETDGLFDSEVDKYIDTFGQGIAQAGALFAVFAATTASKGKNLKNPKNAKLLKDFLPVLSQGKNVPMQLAAGFMHRERMIDSYIEQGMSVQEARRNAVLDAVGIGLTSMFTGRLVDKGGNLLLRQPGVQSLVLSTARNKAGAAMAKFASGVGQEGVQEVLDELAFGVASGILDRVDILGDRKDNDFIISLEEALHAFVGGIGGGSLGGSTNAIAHINAIHAAERNANMPTIGDLAFGPDGKPVLTDADGNVVEITNENQAEFKRKFRNKMSQTIFQTEIDKAIADEDARVSVFKSTLDYFRDKSERKNIDVNMYGDPSTVIEQGEMRGERHVDLASHSPEVAYTIAGLATPAAEAGVVKNQVLSPLKGNSRNDWKKAGLGWFAKGLNVAERAQLIQAAQESVARLERRVAAQDALAEQRIDARLKESGFVSQEEEIRIREQAREDVTARAVRLEDMLGKEPPKPSEFVGVRPDMPAAQQIITAAGQVASPETTDTVGDDARMTRTDANEEFARAELDALLEETGTTIAAAPNEALAEFQAKAAERNVAVVFVDGLTGNAARDRETGIILVNAKADPDQAMSAVLSHELIHTMQFESKQSYSGLVRSFADADPKAFEDGAREYLKRKLAQATTQELIDAGLDPRAAALAAGDRAREYEFTDAELAQALRMDNQVAYEVLPYAVEMMVRNGDAAQVQRIAKSITRGKSGFIKRVIRRIRDLLVGLEEGKGVKEAWSTAKKWDALITAMDTMLGERDTQIDVDQLTDEDIQATAADRAAAEPITSALIGMTADEDSVSEFTGGPSSDAFNDKRVIPLIAGAAKMSRDRLTLAIRRAKAKAARLRAVGKAFHANAANLFAGGASIDGAVETAKATLVAGNLRAADRSQFFNNYANDLIDSGHDVSQILPAVLRFGVDLGSLTKAQANNLLMRAKNTGVVEQDADLQTNKQFDAVLREELSAIEVDELLDPYGSLADRLDMSLTVPENGYVGSLGPLLSSRTPEQLSRIAEHLAVTGPISYNESEWGGPLMQLHEAISEVKSFGQNPGQVQSIVTGTFRALQDKNGKELNIPAAIRLAGSKEKLLKRLRRKSNKIDAERIKARRALEARIAETCKRRKVTPLDLIGDPDPADLQPGDVYLSEYQDAWKVVLPNGAITDLFVPRKTEIVNDLTSDKAFKYTSTYGVTTQDLKAFGKEGRIAIPDFAMTAQTSKFRIPAHRKGDLQIPEITISIGGDWSINRIEQQYLAFSVNLDKGRQIKDTKGNDIYEIHQGMPDKAVTRLGDNKDLNWAESFPYLGELIGYGVEQILARRATLLGHMSVMHGTGGSPISFGRKKAYNTFHHAFAAKIEDESGIPMGTLADGKGNAPLYAMVHYMLTGRQQITTGGNRARGRDSNVINVVPGLDTLLTEDLPDGSAGIMGLTRADRKKLLSETPFDSLPDAVKDEVIANVAMSIKESGGRDPVSGRRTTMPRFESRDFGARITATGEALPMASPDAGMISGLGYGLDRLPAILVGPIETLYGGPATRGKPIDRAAYELTFHRGLGSEAYILGATPINNVMGIDFTANRLMQVLQTTISAEMGKSDVVSQEEYARFVWNTCQERHRRMYEMFEQGDAPDGTTKLRDRAMVQKQNEMFKKILQQRYTAMHGFVRAWGNPQVAAELRSLPDVGTAATALFESFLAQDGALFDQNGDPRTIDIFHYPPTKLTDPSKNNLADTSVIDAQNLKRIDGGFLQFLALVQMAKKVGDPNNVMSLEPYRIDNEMDTLANTIRDKFVEVLQPHIESHIASMDTTELEEFVNEVVAGTGAVSLKLPAVLAAGTPAAQAALIAETAGTNIAKRMKPTISDSDTEAMIQLTAAMAQGLNPSATFDATEFMLTPKGRKKPLQLGQSVERADVTPGSATRKQLGRMSIGLIVPGVRNQNPREMDFSLQDPSSPEFSDPEKVFDRGINDPDGMQEMLRQWAGEDNQMLTEDGRIPVLFHTTLEPGFRQFRAGPDTAIFLSSSSAVSRTYIPKNNLTDGPVHATMHGMYPSMFMDPEILEATKNEIYKATDMANVTAAIGLRQRLDMHHPATDPGRPMLPEFGISRRVSELNIAIDEFLIPYDKDTEEFLADEDIRKQYKPNRNNRPLGFKSLREAVERLEIIKHKQKLEQELGLPKDNTDSVMRDMDALMTARRILEGHTDETLKAAYADVVVRHSAIYKAKKKPDPLDTPKFKREPMPESPPDAMLSRQTEDGRRTKGLDPDYQAFDYEVLAYGINDPDSVVEHYNKNANALANIKGSMIPFVPRAKNPVVINGSNEQYSNIPLFIDGEPNLPEQVLMSIVQAKHNEAVESGNLLPNDPGTPVIIEDAKQFVEDYELYSVASTDEIVRAVKRFGRFDGIIIRNVIDLMPNPRNIELIRREVAAEQGKNYEQLMETNPDTGTKNYNTDTEFLTRFQERLAEFRGKPEDIYVVFDSRNLKAPTLNKTGVVKESRNFDESLPSIDDVMRVFNKSFRSSADLPRKVFERKFQRDSEIKRYKVEAAQRNAELRRGLDKDVKNSKDKEALRQMVDRAIKSNNFEALRPFPHTHAAAVAMRATIDKLTIKMIDSGMLSEKLEKTFKENLGFYVNRSYQVFDDPNWAKKVPQETRNRMKALLRSQYPEASPEQLENMMEKLLFVGKGSGSVIDVLASESIPLDVLTKRKDINKTLREFWGEYTDPEINFTKSIEKMSAAMAQMKFLDDISTYQVTVDGKLQPMFEDAGSTSIPADYVVEIPKDPRRWGKLAGKRTSDRLWEAIQAVDKGDIINQWWYRQYIRANASVKWGKTVGSPMTHVRNMVGNIGFAVANGHIGTGAPEAVADAMKSLPIFTAVTGMLKAKTPGDKLIARRKAEKAYAELVELGVVQAGNLNEVLQLLEEASTSRFTVKDLFNRMIDKGGASAITGRGLRAAYNGATKLNALYMAEDDVWKMFAFAYEKNRYHEAYRQAGETPPPDLDRKLAKIVRDTYPNYDMVPKFIRLLRQVPFMGTFVSFPSEVLRTGIARVQITAAELSNPVTRAIGMKRAIGQLLAYGTASVGASAITAAFGVGDEEEEALRKVIAPWSQNSPLIIMKTEDGKYKYIDLGYTDPHAMLFKPVMALLRGSSVDEALFGNSASGQQGFFGEVMAPFFGEEILFGSVIEVTTGRTKTGRPVYGPGDSKLDKWRKVTAHLFGDLAPGAYRQLAEIPAKAIMGITDDYGKVYDLPTHLTSVATGFRIEPIDVEQAFSYKARTFGRIEQGLRGELSKVAGRSGTVSERELRVAYQRINDNRLRNLQAFRELVGRMEALGLNRRQMMDLLVAGGIAKKRVRFIVDGIHQPVEIDHDYLQNYRERPMTDDAPLKKRGELRRRIKILQEEERRAGGG